MNASDILTRNEIKSVIQQQHKLGRRSVNARQNLIIFRLSCCCGLRVKELCGLNCGDLILFGEKPTLRVRKEITKGQDGKRKARLVPLWWDSGTLSDLQAWMDFRVMQGAGKRDPFVCGQSASSLGRRLTTDLAAKRWRTAIKCLGPARRRQLHIHCGRHSYCSHTLASGRNLVKVRDAAGHANVTTTNIYLHVADDDHLPDIFGA